MSHLHLGTFDADALIDLLPKQEDRRIFRGSDLHNGEGPDSWEEWGEGKPGVGQPEHIVIVGDSPDLLADVAWVLSQSPDLLQPMTYEYQAGTLACITPDDDWSEPYYTLEDTQSERFVKRLLQNGVGENDVWAHPEWRERQGQAPIVTGQ